MAGVENDVIVVSDSEDSSDDSEDFDDDDIGPLTFIVPYTKRFVSSNNTTMLISIKYVYIFWLTFLFF